jgi:nicotinamidase-related amidase
MLNRENAVLVVVDVQGRLATLMHEKERFFENLVRVIKGARVLKIPVLWNEQLPDKLGETIGQLKEILADLSPLVKKTFSCCGNSEFSDRLAALKRKQVLLTGMETHVCVYQTAADLLRQNYEVHLVADAVSSRTLDNKQIGIEATIRSGARITSVEMALFEMLQTAQGDEFKQIIDIVK